MTGLLIFIGLILIILNVLAIKKQKRSFNGMLGNAMGNIKEDDIRIGELRLEFSESILEVQSEIMVIKKMLEKRSNLNEIISEQPIINNSSTKVKEIKRLFSEGFSTEEISEILHLGKGEVLLIKDLYIK